MTQIKKHDSTYFVENNWTDKNGKEQTATVRLEINYSNKKCGIRPAIADRFVFSNGNLDEWITVANCIRNAAEFAKVELDDKKEESGLHEPEEELCRDFQSNFAVLEGEHIIMPVPHWFAYNGRYMFEGEKARFNHKEAIDLFFRKNGQSQSKVPVALLFDINSELWMIGSVCEFYAPHIFPVAKFFP